MSNLPFTPPLDYIEIDSGAEVIAVKVLRFPRGLDDYHAMEKAIGAYLPVGVCDCGRLMDGIPGGCQIHIHYDKSKRGDDLAIGDWIVYYHEGKLRAEKNSNFQIRFRPLNSV